MNRTGILCLFLLIFVGFGVSSAGMDDSTAEGIDPGKQVTFYHTYGYKKKEMWVIPMRIWVHEKPEITGHAASRVAREILAGKAGIAGLNKQKKDLFKARTEAFFADSESNEVIGFQFDNDPDERDYYLQNADGDDRTDRNRRVEGVIMLSEQTVQTFL